MKIIRKPVAVAVYCLACVLGLPARAADITVNAAQTNQVIEGLGANINHRSWTNNDLKPVLDGMIDQGGFSLFRVIFDRADWEGTNDNSDPDVMDTNYYNALYSSARFQPLWGLINYLDQKGLSNGIMLNFQGTGPDWMGGTMLTPGLEDEWAEMIASLLVYARNTQQLQFSLVAPENEPNNSPEGIGVTGAAQYVTMLHSLAQKLDTNGLGDFRLVGPDLAFSPTGFMPEMMADPVVMVKLAHFGVHSYTGAGTDSQAAGNLISSSAYSNTTFWITEFNNWCPNCNAGVAGDNTWSFSRTAAEYLFAHLANGASAACVWEGYDGNYTIFGEPAWSFWGVYAVDDTNAVSRTYTPRKSFYTLAQFAKFIRPGAQNVALNGSTSELEMLAFYHQGTGQFTITGINTQGLATSLNATLSSLPPLSNLDLYYTDSSVNLAHAGSVPVTGNSFATIIPPDCVFSLTGFVTFPPPPVLSVALLANNVALSWTNTATNFSLETTADLGSPAPWSPVTNAPLTNAGQVQVILNPLDAQRFFRLHKP